MTIARWTTMFRFSVTCVIAVLTSAASAVEFANIDITFNGATPNPPTVTIPSGQSTSGFGIGTGAVLGEYPIQIGGSASGDATGGVLLGYVRENGRDVSDADGLLYATSSTVRDSDPTSVNTRNAADGLALAVHRAGEAGGSSAFPTHAPFAADLAAAYFPFSEGWLAGTASSSANGGPINQFDGSPGLALGTNFVVDGIDINRHRLRLPGVTDSRRQGFLFVNHAKNEANFAYSEPADDGDGFIVETHDNATNGPTTTVDPLSFVYIPLGTPNVTLARIHPHSGPNLDPMAMQQSGLPFTIVREGPVVDPAFNTGIGGKFRLSIPGQSPTSGTLLVSPSTGFVGNSNNRDNIVTYEADGNDWIILSQDLPTLDGTGAFSAERASYFNFAFLPFDAPATAPGPIQAPAWNTSRIVGWNANVVEVGAGGGPLDSYTNITQSTSDVSVQSLNGNNKGDNGVAVGGDFLVAQDGVLFATISEGLRENTPSGVTDYGTVTTGFFVPEWIVFLANADPVLNGEFNVNYSAVFFGADSGFNPVGNAPTTGGVLEVILPGVNSLNDGVLMATAFGESPGDDNYALVSPKSDGSGWDVEIHDNSTGFEDDPVNYVYLPYDSQNLIAGRVAEDGMLIKSTDTNAFTLTKQGTGEYLLSIPGKTPETGMLMLTGTGLNGSVDNSVVYEPAGNNFLILGLDMITRDEAGLGQFVDLEDTEFSFAYIDFDAPPIFPNAGGLVGDYNGDNVVDAADYTVWRDALGSTETLPNDNIGGTIGAAQYQQWKDHFGETAGALQTAANQAVPEPTSAVLAIFALTLAGLYRPRR